MLKQILGLSLLILMSILVVLGMPQIKSGLVMLLSAHHWIAAQLTQVFSGGEAGNISRQLIALLALPIIIGLIPVIVFFIAKRRWFPYFTTVFWTVWLVQAAALIAQS